MEERPAVLSEAETYRRKVEELNREFPGAADMGITPTAPVVPLTQQQTMAYKDKGEVIAALTERKIAHNPRASRATLEKLLQ